MPALQENNKFDEVVDLMRYFKPHSLELIKALCDGRYYQGAILEAVNVPDLQVDFIRNHLNDFANQTIEKIHADHTQFKTHVTRLQTVRKQKAEKQLNGDADDNDCDMFSDTTSMNSSRFTGASKGSTRSQRSSKSKRKHERKLMSLKEGNPFEDIALIDAIYTMVHKIFDQQQQVHELLKSLVDFELDTIGIEVQKRFHELLEDVRRTLGSVWLPEMMVTGEIKVEEYMDFLRVQKEQHYAMISKIKSANIGLNF